jgi:hypothetical protein
MGSRLCFAKN